MSRPLLLDLFCCAGGASKGYHDAGFDVVGVDIEPQKHYPYEFIQADALNMLDTLLMGGTTNDARIDHKVGWGYRLASFDAFAASPPCQGYSVTKSVNPQASSYPLLIPKVRELLNLTGKPYAIENVEGAKRDMINPLTLCGSQFGLVRERMGHQVYLRRHRLFETNFMVPEAGPHKHEGRAMPVFGNGVGGKKWPAYLKGPGTNEFVRELMGIDWTTREELGQALPPAYTEYIGIYMQRAIAFSRAHLRELAA